MALGNSLNTFFDHIFCVNLDRRPDKWALCLEEFAKWGIEAERFPAIEGSLYWLPRHRVPPGSIGNCMSKIDIIKLAIERKYRSVLILEDDVEFAEDFQHKFTDWSREVPSNWDMFWIGGNHNLWKPGDYRGVVMVSEHIMRLNNTYSSHAFALRDTVYDMVLKALEPLEPQDDIILADIQKKTNAYGFRPNLAFQRPGISDVHNIHTDYSFMRDQ